MVRSIKCSFPAMFCGYKVPHRTPLSGGNMSSLGDSLTIQVKRDHDIYTYGAPWGREVAAAISFVGSHGWQAQRQTSREASASASKTFELVG